MISKKTNELTRKDIDSYLALQLKQQYMNEDLDFIFNKYGEKKVMKFLSDFQENSKKYGHIRIRTIVSEEEIEEFIKYSRETDVKPTSKPLNAKNFLKMCRVCYDAAPLKIYPKGVSDYFIYQDERHTKFHEDSTVLDPKCYEDDKEFIKNYPGGAYHFEELRFGGPSIFIKTFSTYKKVKGKNVKVNTWKASFSGKTFEDGRGIKMFIALRKNGYPVTVNNPEEMLYSYLGSEPNDIDSYKYFYSVEEAKKYVKEHKNENATH